ncbi:MAG: ABC transporter ATP-binding protein [Solirubrobacterales bacterium]|nr:ABC transporter ATP-binding protein [Solirubrobacterales bacterium]
MLDAPAVSVQAVSKEFRLPHEQVHTLKERALHPFKRSGEDRFQALEDVTFDVAPGEFFGIVGRNGSGKSTLLKCLAGIYRIDRGAIRMRGQLSTFIELGVGFNADLPARDNVLINGIMLGLTPREALRRFDRIIDFAELQEFVDLKLKNYSSGMHVRLAFSVMSHVDADILLIDEVLAVGDASFQQKCFDVFQRLKDEGKTILFVTHDMSAVTRFCDRAVLLERGRVQLIDEPDLVGARYMQANFDRGGDGGATTGEDEPGRIGDGSAEITDAWFEVDDSRTEVLPQGSSCTACVRVRFHASVAEPAIAILIENDRHDPLWAISNEDGDAITGSHEAGDEAVFSVLFDNVFTPGRLFLTPWMVHAGGGRIIDRRPRIASGVVTAVHRSGGLVDLPHAMRYERTARAPA